MSPQKGFSTIELLVAVTIVSVLAAIAIIQYPEYKARSFNARAISDLKNIISAQEAAFADTETFVADLNSLTGFDTSSPSVSVILNASGNAWAGSTYHPRGTKTYCFDSATNLGIVTLEGINQSCT